MQSQSNRKRRAPEQIPEEDEYHEHPMQHVAAEQQIGDDMVMAVPEAPPEASDADIPTLKDESDAAERLEELRNYLKQQYFQNPHLEWKEPDERIKIIDTLNEEQLKLLQLQVRHQTTGLIDDAVASRSLNESAVASDELVQKCFKTVMGTLLHKLPTELKFAFLFGHHLVNAAQAHRARQELIYGPNPSGAASQTESSLTHDSKRQKTTTATPMQTDH